MNTLPNIVDHIVSMRTGLLQTHTGTMTNAYFKK